MARDQARIKAADEALPQRLATRWTDADRVLLAAWGAALPDEAEEKQA